MRQRSGHNETQKIKDISSLFNYSGMQIFNLAQMVQKKVKQKFGVDLEVEVNIIL